ncbi:MAG: hypothetical protein EOO61_21235 [Hymenobacter sp.]|nr:MAG: hypothetical protein EOO61_21235 [Hymenobacter sp.]
MQHYETIEEEDREFGKNWVTSSRFLFFVTVFTSLAFIVGCSMQIYHHRYTGKPKVDVPSSTLYTPKYQ